MRPPEKLLAQLEQLGWQPRQMSPMLWVALCPACLAKGRVELLEIQLADHGAPDVRCRESES